ncbi:pyridoxal-phosphate dependent enzyme [Caballeronia sp. LZ033]|uniref:threonine synthase n=1 Tax=Caballeronia sp. LZ033 TaxID=3038566 RepID=UPI00285C73B2|nr:pyridoxal-phosphate dependent enzyme [Caballeronia sp. LZ033]MDR5818695.1 pyridoxal-phosphate dependent enzyme [Caballeronia sp. LZ033]
MNRAHEAAGIESSLFESPDRGAANRATPTQSGSTVQARPEVIDRVAADHARGLDSLCLVKRESFSHEPGIFMNNVVRNPLLIGFRSLDGQSHFGVGDWFEGDPASRSRGEPTSVAAEYRPSELSLPPCVGPMRSYGAWLPYLDFPSLGEGGTPAVDVPAIADAMGLDRLIFKRESANPTGSHKDRMTPLALARAIETGAAGVVCASSGNAAISLAAYASAASVKCRVLVTASISDAYRSLLERMNAEIVVCRTHLDRWKVMAGMVSEGWYPITNFALPAVGSNPYGVQGYKTVAYEIFQQAGAVDDVVVPCARGDLLWGIGEGFDELKRAGMIDKVPRLHAVEPFPRLSRVLQGQAKSTDLFSGDTQQFSIAGDTTTDQAVRAVTASRGSAVCVDDTLAAVAQSDAARHGFDLELSSASALGAIRILKANGTLPHGATVVMIATASSAREPVAAGAPLAAPNA